MTEKEFRDLFDSVRCSEAFRARMEEKLSEPPAEGFAEIASGVAPAPVRSRWVRYAGLAACFLFVIGGGALYLMGRGGMPDQPPVTTDAPTQSTTTAHTEETTGTTTASLQTESVVVTVFETAVETVPATEIETGTTTTAQTTASTTTTTQTTTAVTTTSIPATETEETTTTAAPALTGWQAAYWELADGFAEEQEFTGEARFSLIYFDEDAVPELAVSAQESYQLFLYTYHEGNAVELIDGWSFGAMGNTGYLYVPYQNSLQNYNHDYAGLLGYTSYMSITPQKTLEVTDVIETWNFNDLNGNGFPDEGEYDNELNFTAYYVDGVEITAEEAAAYAKGEYQPIGGTLTLEELRTALELS